MFSQPNPVIVQIRRELRGNSRRVAEEVISILEYQLTYQTLDELATNDLLKLKLGLRSEPDAQRHALASAQPHVTRARNTVENPFPVATALAVKATRTATLRVAHAQQKAARSALHTS
jgi:hypothetical protein